MLRKTDGGGKSFKPSYDKPKTTYAPKSGMGRLASLYNAGGQTYDKAPMLRPEDLHKARQVAPLIPSLFHGAVDQVKSVAKLRHPIKAVQDERAKGHAFAQGGGGLVPPMGLNTLQGRFDTPVLGAKYGLRPLGKGNTLQDKLKVLNRAKTQIASDFMAHHGEHPEAVPRKALTNAGHLARYDHYHYTAKLHDEASKVDINAIMKKQPWEMTKAEMIAHPYTVFHNTKSRPGLGNLSGGIHAGTLEAADARKMLRSTGTKIHPMWMFPGERARVGEGKIEPYVQNNEYIPAPGKQLRPAMDSGFGTPISNGINELWRRHWQGMEKMPAPDYGLNPGPVKNFFDNLPHINTEGQHHWDEAKNTDLFPYENNAEHPGSISYETHNPNVMKTHQQMVLEALDQGLPVPKRVLREYPGIQRKLAKFQRRGGLANAQGTHYGRDKVREIPGFNKPHNRLGEYKAISRRFDVLGERAAAREEMRRTGVPVSLPQFVDDTLPQPKVKLHEGDWNALNDLGNDLGGLIDIPEHTPTELKNLQGADYAHIYDLYSTKHSQEAALKHAGYFHAYEAEDSVLEEARNFFGLPKQTWQHMTEEGKHSALMDFLKYQVGPNPVK